MQQWGDWPRLSGARGRGALLGGLLLTGLLLGAGASAASGVSARPHLLLSSGAGRSAPATRLGHIAGIVLSRKPHALPGASRSRTYRFAGPGTGLGSGSLKYRGGPVMHQSTA